MISLRSALRLASPALRAAGSPSAAARTLSSSPPPSDVAIYEDEYKSTKEALEAEKSPVQRHLESLTKRDPHMVFGSPDDPPPPALPDNPAEVAALDPAHFNQDPLTPDGRRRTVTIRQETAKHPTQSPLNSERHWIISFQDFGEHANCWDNPLMGWVSGADPMSSNMKLQMVFNDATEAVYFAKKRGWEYVVEEPKLRRGRDDDAQYQDNFLPQAVAGLVKRDKRKCDHWHRAEAGSSHYFRPLKYHGNGTVRQHGPNREDKLAPHVEGQYKMR